MSKPIDRRPVEEPDNAGRAVDAAIAQGIARNAADSLLALVRRRDPSFEVTAANHDPAAALIEALAAAIART